MNHLLNKLERKLGRHAIPNLILWLLAGYAIGFTLAYTAPEVLSLILSFFAPLRQQSSVAPPQFGFLPHYFFNFVSFPIDFTQKRIYNRTIAKKYTNGRGVT